LAIAGPSVQGQEPHFDLHVSDMTRQPATRRLSGLPTDATSSQPLVVAV